MGELRKQQIPSFNADRYQKILERVDPIRRLGQVDKVVGLTIEAVGPPTFLGEACILRTLSGEEVLGEVVGFREGKVLLLPLDEMEGIGPSSEVIALGKKLEVPVGDGLLGRVLDGLGRPIDHKGAVKKEKYYPLLASPPNPLTRSRIKTPLALGVKAIDALLTCGKGQRLGIFSGSGVGKSTLLGMIARHSSADVNVIGLIGERGREVKEFMEKDLGPEGLSRSVVVVATSDQPALVRIKGAYTATAIAEYFRDTGANVMLMMDSITRFALAQREVGLAVGEPPATRGYTPSVFALIPKLLERSGTANKGSITALYTVLVEGDDMNEPVADTVRGTLDGHIVLSRALAHENHYPAIDVLASVSRLMIDLAASEHLESAAALREILAVYKANEDLINIGAYVAGSNPRVDLAIKMYPLIMRFLRQDVHESISLEQTVAELLKLMTEG
ncbi:MAG TPA: flagellar protein export ATPase FliI [Firmicutes bacterium]|jgi:flagellum-specific ATP synthase|nr:flagellar protein export ATPase FliI [Bacillota bacterium]